MKYNNLFKRMRRYFREIGLHVDDADEIITAIRPTLESQGLPGALDYFKSIYQGVLWSRMGQGSKPAYVKFRGGHPFPVRCLRRYDVETALKVATFFKCITFEDVTPKQLSKLVSGVTTPYTGDLLAIKLAHELCLLSAEQNGFLRTDFSSPNSEYSLISQTFRRVMSESGDTPSQTFPSTEEAFIILADNPVLLGVPNWESAFWPIYPNECRKIIERIQTDRSNTVPKDMDKDFTHLVGEIHSKQEAGGKLRMFAAPYSIVQILLTPIHNWVKKVRDTLLTDCTNFQEEGVQWGVYQINAGKTVHSVDLSTATCRFPLELQLKVLLSLGLPQEWINVLSYVVRAKWEVGTKEVQSGFPDYLSWVCGQPLGTKPSMSMFSLTHNLLLGGLCVHLGLFAKDNFRVLGDDVLISNDQLADAYKNIIKGLGVPISYDKTYSSNIYGEFAGFKFSNSFSFRPGQWREPEFQRLLGISEFWGKPTPHLVSKRWAKVQQVHLFALGRIDTTSMSMEEYSECLKINSLVKSKDKVDVLDWWRSESSYITRYTGITRFLRKSQMRILNRIRCMPPETTFSRVWSPVYQAIECMRSRLPEAEWTSFLAFARNWEHSATYADEPNVHLSACMARNVIWSALLSDKLSFCDFQRVMDSIDSALLHYLWVRPRKTEIGSKDSNDAKRASLILSNIT